MSSLKQKTISGLLWTFTESFANQFISFIFGIILARLLTPEDYGLVGMITVFVVIAQVFIDSGFSSALIQKQDIGNKDYSTVFVFNLSVSVFLYIIVFFGANFVAEFYERAILEDLLKVLALMLIFNALSIVQNTKLLKTLNFKVLTKVTVTSHILSGLIGVIFALTGFGVWSLVIKTITQSIINTGLLWFFSRWKPSFVFDFTSFKTMFNYGYKLLLSGLLDRLYQNIYFLIIGKIFSPATLGYFTRASQFKDLASKNITGTFQKVTFPSLAPLQNDDKALVQAYKKIIKNMMFITSFTMATLFVISEPLIIILIGEKWRASIPLLQLLCFVGVWYPIHALNLNLLKVKGRSDLFLKLEIIKKCIGFPVVIGMSFLGIEYLIIGSICTSIIALWINTYYTGKIVNYKTLQQLWDISPALFIAIISGVLTILISFTLPDIMWLKLILQLIMISGFFYLFSTIFKIKELPEMKNIILQLLRRKVIA